MAAQPASPLPGRKEFSHSLGAWARRAKRNPDRREVKTNTEIQCRNPGGVEPRPAKAGSQPEANMAASSERAARSVWSMSKSRVLEPRRKQDRWRLRIRSRGGRAEAPKSRPGAEAGPGAEGAAHGPKGSLGTWEIRLSPCAQGQSRGETGLTTPRRTGSGLAFGASETTGSRSNGAQLRE